MYNSTDPRALLAPVNVPSSSQTAGEFAAASYLNFDLAHPDEAVASARLWYGRGQNFVLSYVEAAAGAVLERAGQADESILLLPDTGLEVDNEANGEQVQSGGYALVIAAGGKPHHDAAAGTFGAAVHRGRRRSARALRKCRNLRDG